VDSKLSFSDHITDKVNKAYSILGIIKRNFPHVDKVAFVLLYKALAPSLMMSRVFHTGGNMYCISYKKVFKYDINILFSLILSNVCM